MANQRLSSKRSRQLLHDVVMSQMDIEALAKKYHLSLTNLADWLENGAHGRTVINLCRLADLQTQLLLSRFRGSAALRLISMARGDDGAETSYEPELSRKACIDLLRLELKRAAGSDEGGEDAGTAEFLAALHGGDGSEGDDGVGAVIRPKVKVASRKRRGKRR